MAAQTKTQQQRKAAGRKAAASRARNSAARQSAQPAAQAGASRHEAEVEVEKIAVHAEGALEASAAYALERAKALASEAERAVLIPLGATLIARDKTLIARDNVVELLKPYSSPQGAQRELTRNVRKFERRGVTVRNRAVRQLEQTRTRVERIVHSNRVQERELDAARRDFERKAERIQHASEDIAKGVQELAGVAA